MVIGLPKIKFSKGVCQGCVLGKHPEHKFERTSAPLELIQSDVFGPFSHMSMSQAKYALTFIDDFSRYCWFYFLKHKSEGGDSKSSVLTMVVSMSSLSSFNIVKM